MRWDDQAVHSFLYRDGRYVGGVYHKQLIAYLMDNGGESKIGNFNSLTEAKQAVESYDYIRQQGLTLTP